MNRELRSTRTVLGYLVDADLFPRLTHDDLRRALKRLPLTIERAEFLRSPEIRLLLEAALAHNEATFAETRGEHSGPGRARIGTTKRYEPIAPFVAFLLLSGCRLGEALSLDWSSVDLDTVDQEGRPAGEVYIAGANAKTRRGRAIDLSITPFPARPPPGAAWRPQERSRVPRRRHGRCCS